MNSTNQFDRESHLIILKEETIDYSPTIKINPNFLKSISEFFSMKEGEEIIINGDKKEWILFFTVVIEKYLTFRDNDNEVLDIVLSGIKNDDVLNTEIMETFLKLVSKDIKITDNTEINMTGSVLDFEKYFQLLKVIDYRISQSLLTNYPSGFKIKD